MTCPLLADVAELADAQVSEACDGDIVEVQVLSSAPWNNESESFYATRFFVCPSCGTRSQ
jgi:hypothetical protein